MGGTNVSTVSNLTPEQRSALALALKGNDNTYTGLAQNYISGLSQSKPGLSTMQPASSYYKDVLSGKTGAESEKYNRDVIGSIRSEGAQTYGDMSRALATKFSRVGGYYGGTSGVAQGRLAGDTARGINSNIASVKANQYSQDQANKANAASGLTETGTKEAGINNALASILLQGQGLDIQKLLGLLGVSAVTPVVTQDGFSSLLGAIGNVGGQVAYKHL